MERLDKYKYLDMFIDDRLSFDHKTADLQEGTACIVCIIESQTLCSRSQLYGLSFAHLLLSTALPCEV